MTRPFLYCPWRERNFRVAGSNVSDGHSTNRARKLVIPFSELVLHTVKHHIRDFDRAAGNTAAVEELYHEMPELISDRLNPGALWSSTRGVKG